MAILIVHPEVLRVLIHLRRGSRGSVDSSQLGDVIEMHLATTQSLEKSLHRLLWERSPAQAHVQRTSMKVIAILTEETVVFFYP